MGLGKLLVYTRKLNNIGRWANEYMGRRASVAEHSYCVAQIAQMLAFIEEENGAVINWKVLYRKALNHDVTEALVGDVLSTTKNYSQEAKKALAIVENELVNKHLLSPLAEPYQSLYREALFDGKDATPEGRLLAIADDIDALIECIQEVKLSNTDPFLEKYSFVLGKIVTHPMPSVAVFLRDILPLLTENCEKLQAVTKKTLAELPK